MTEATYLTYPSSRAPEVPEVPEVPEAVEPAGQPAPQAGKPVIASVTISNGSQDIIADALGSVVDVVDLCILVDDGIRDKTVEVARSVAGTKLRVCKLPRRTGPIDFAAARNKSLDYARAYKADWALFCDTDERFHWSGCDLRARLRETEADTILVTSADGVYPKDKCFRLGSGVHYYGPAHEVSRGGGGSETLSGVAFSELGKTREQYLAKVTRDVAVLTEWLKDPEHAVDGRWWFYLGQSYAGLGNLDEAVKAYGECVNRRRGISEEGAWAALQAAKLLTEQCKYEQAVELCAVGLARYSGTAELCLQAADACWRWGMLEQAACWARMAVANGKHAPVDQGYPPGPRHLFCDPAALYEGPYELLRGLCANVPELRARADAGFKAAQAKRLGLVEVSGDVEAACVDRKLHEPTRQRLRWELRPRSVRRVVEGALAWDVEIPQRTLSEAGVGDYHAMNPSLCAHQGRLLCVVRAVNYTIESGDYRVPDADGRVRTANFLADLSLDGGGRVVLGDVRLMRDLDEAPRSETRVLGYEDDRLASSGGKLWGSATVRDRGQDRPKVVLLHLTPEGDVERAEVQETGRGVEKNWMPVADGGSPRWVYEVDPCTIRHPGGAAERRRCELGLDHCKGGSQVVPWQDGYLCVAHETIVFEGGGCRRIYLHRFVRFDRDLNVSAVSPSWVFEDGHHGVEFCTGMVSWQGRLLIGYGVEDRQAKILVVDEKLGGVRWIRAS